MIENTAFIALSRQIAMRRQLDVIANNVANMNTTAFRAERMMFEEYLTETEDGTELSYVLDSAVRHDMQEGEMRATENALDLAISGSGYFVVETEAGERYTRNGHFRTDADGLLVTDGGHAVLDEAGQPIVLAAGGSSLTISKDGTVTTAAGAAAQLAVVTFANEQALVPEGTSLYRAEAGNPPLPAQDATILQHMLEASNVIPIIEMTNLIEVSRSYQKIQQLLQRDSELRQQAIRQLGQVA